MKLFLKITVLLLATILAGCDSSATEEMSIMEKYGPSHVEMRKENSQFRLYVNGEEFFVKGAGCASDRCYLVSSYGGNSIRTWNTYSGSLSGLELLDDAWENGLMVMMGLHVERERHGFDYEDKEAVRKQLERLRSEVEELKDHPALLGWGIGNELNLRYTNPIVWDAVNDIARMIKEVDGNHVVTTMLAGANKETIETIAERCPDLDFISFQMYGGIVNLQAALDRAGYDGPYLVTEWGATGHWEVPTTEWGSPIEQTSSEKADIIKERYHRAILSDPDRCMGSYIFLWGQKQERTPSWYGLFTENDEKTEPMQVMQYLWTGQWPEIMAPRFNDITIKGYGNRYDNVFLEAGKEYTSLIDIEHDNFTSLRVRAEVMPEPTELSEGGDYEPRPASIEGLILSVSPSQIVFQAPEKTGPYRLLVYVVDDKNIAATANIPFYVRQ